MYRDRKSGVIGIIITIIILILIVIFNSLNVDAVLVNNSVIEWPSMQSFP